MEGKTPDPGHLKDFLPSRFMVCFDGSVHSLKALEAGISLASRYNGKVITAYAIPLPLNGFGLGEPYYDWEQYEKDARKRLEGLIRPYSDRASTLYVPLEISYLGGSVSVADTLSKASTDMSADMVIMGSRGLGGFKGMFLGSVSQAMVSNSKVPVLIVK